MPLWVAASPVMGTSVTVMTTVSGLLATPKLSVTVRLKVSTVGSAGAVKVVVDSAPAALKLTGGPPLCTQRYANSRWPSGSKDWLPSKMNCLPILPDWSGPAFACGSWLITTTLARAVTCPAPLTAVTVT